MSMFIYTFRWVYSIKVLKFPNFRKSSEQKRRGKEKILFGRSRQPRLTYSEAVRLVKEEMEQEKSDLDKLTRKAERSNKKSKSSSDTVKEESATFSKEKGSKTLEKLAGESSVSSEEVTEESIVDIVQEELEDYEEDFESEIQTDLHQA